MTSREEAKKLNPDATFWVGFHQVYPDEYSLFSILINWFFQKIGSRLRARLVIHEDAIRASGIWTPEQAGDVANRLVIGEDGNFMDPQKWSFRKIFKRLSNKNK